MQIVIDIPEVMYEGVKLHRVLDTTVDCIIDAVEDGTPLPKGHGRLIDEKDLSLMTVHIIDGVFVYCDAPTIIEADKESEETE